MTEYQTVEGTTPTADFEHEPRVIKRIDAGDDLKMMTEIGDGVFVQWGECRRCNKRVAECKCPGGPVEPDYMVKWRTERFNFDGRPIPFASTARRKVLDNVLKELREQGYRITAPGTKKVDHTALLKRAQKAQDAAYGDSNDDEIDLLRSALEEALVALGLELPEGRDPDDDEIDPAGDEAVLEDIESRGGNEPISEIHHTGKYEVEAEAEEAAVSDSRQNVDDGLSKARAAVLAAQAAAEGDPDVGF